MYHCKINTHTQNVLLLWWWWNLSIMIKYTNKHQHHGYMTTGQCTSDGWLKRLQKRPFNRFAAPFKVWGWENKLTHSNHTLLGHMWVHGRLSSYSSSSHTTASQYLQETRLISEKLQLLEVTHRNAKKKLTHMLVMFKATQFTHITALSYNYFRSYMASELHNSTCTTR